MLPIINKNTMLVDIEAEDKLSLIQQMVDKFDSEGYLCDKEQFHKDVLDREEVFSTYIEYGIGIPHGKSDGVEEPGVCIARLKTPIQWTDEEDEKVLLGIRQQPQPSTDAVPLPRRSGGRDCGDSGLRAPLQGELDRRVPDH